MAVKVSWLTYAVSARVLLVAAVLVALVPGTVHGACYGGRCPTGEDTGETKVNVRITIAIEPAESGVVEVDGEELEEDSFQVTQGETVTLEADPSRGYRFVGWSGSITSTQNPLVTPFYNNKSITAHFALEEDTAGSSPELAITVPEGTVALDPEGEQIEAVTVDTAGKHHTPDDMVIVSDVYDLGPDGATFDPAFPLALPYDEDNLPEGVAASGLVIAWFDEDSEQWVVLDSSVDDDDRVVEAHVAHFTDFCIMAPRPEGAAVAMAGGAAPGFSLSGLDVSPVEPRVGETVTVSVVASYSGDAIEGGTILTLEIDGSAVESRQVVIPSGENRHVAFTYVPASDSTHIIAVNGLEGVFEVAAAEPPAALTEAVALADKDSFELPQVGLPSLHGMPELQVRGLIGHWWWALLVALAVLVFCIGLPLLRRRIARIRYDI